MITMAGGTDLRYNVALQDCFVRRPHLADDQVVCPVPADMQQPDWRSWPLYAAAVRIEADVTQRSAAPFGPFPRGRELGYTLGEWEEAGGQAIYVDEGSQAQLQVRAWGLRPQGLYAVWAHHSDDGDTQEVATLLFARLSQPGRDAILAAAPHTNRHEPAAGLWLRLSYSSRLSSWLMFFLPQGSRAAERKENRSFPLRSCASAGKLQFLSTSSSQPTKEKPV
jgi:hypothetical protein